MRHLQRVPQRLLQVAEASRSVESIWKENKHRTPTSFCTAVKVFSTHHQAIANCLKNTTQFKVCQELETLTIMLLWKVFWEGSKARCENTSAIGSVTLSVLSLNRPSITLIMNVRFGSETENHQSCFEQNWRLENFLSINYWLLQYRQRAFSLYS